MPRKINMPPMSEIMPHTFGVYDDFEYDKDIWTDTTDGTVAVSATAFGGHCVLTTGAVDNNEAYRATGAIFQFAADKPLVCTARMKYTEAATDNAAVIFGVQTDLNADAIVNGGLTPSTSSAYAALWFKPKDSLYWTNVNYVNGTGTSTQTTETTGAGVWQTLRIQYEPKTSALAEITYWIDPLGGNDMQHSRQYGAHDRAPAIKHTITSLAGGTVGLIVGNKAGGANSEVLTVDYIECWQAR